MSWYSCLVLAINSGQPNVLSWEAATLQIKKIFWALENSQWREFEKLEVSQPQEIKVELYFTWMLKSLLVAWQRACPSTIYPYWLCVHCTGVCLDKHPLTALAWRAPPLQPRSKRLYGPVANLTKKQLLNRVTCLFHYSLSSLSLLSNILKA